MKLGNILILLINFKWPLKALPNQVWIIFLNFFNQISEIFFISYKIMQESNKCLKNPLLGNMHVQNLNCRENCEIWTLLNCHWSIMQKWPIGRHSKTRFFQNWILRNTHRPQPFDFYEIALRNCTKLEFRKRGKGNFARNDFCEWLRKLFFFRAKLMRKERKILRLQMETLFISKPITIIHYPLLI